MEIAALAVPRATFSMEEPWAIPAACSAEGLVRATDGGAARLPTSVAVYYDDDFLTVVFVAADDDDVVATYRVHDEPLWQEDVVEIFLAPTGLTPYLELEVNPLGTTFDARIDSPDGVRATMKTELGWTCEGLFAASRRDDGRTWRVVVRIPFVAVGNAPGPGDEWRANFFRIDRSERHGNEFMAWQPTEKTPPDFHVAMAFGALRFS